MSKQKDLMRLSIKLTQRFEDGWHFQERKASGAWRLQGQPTHIVSHLAARGYAQGLVPGSRRYYTCQDYDASGKSGAYEKNLLLILFLVLKKEKIIGFAKDTSHQNSQLIVAFFGLTFSNFIKV